MFERNDPQIDRLLSLVGGVAVTFAIMETALDLCISGFYYNLGANELVTEMPRTAMNKKLEFLRTVFAPETKFGQSFPKMLEVADTVEAYAEHRHQIIHGAARLTFDADGATAFSRLKRTKSDLQQIVMTVTPEHIETFIEQVHALAVFLTNFVTVLFTEPDDGNKPSGEGAV
jgi:hypothetical protein